MKLHRIREFINFRGWLGLLVLGVWATQGGCAGVGHARIEGERSNYNVAIQRSNDEQLLLNLVRLRYRDTPFFLEVSSVATQFSYRAGANSRATLQDGVKGIFNLGAEAAVEERPTVTYAPLQGEEFIQRFLSQIPIESVVLLARTGWSLERVLRVCLQRMGPLKNAPSASGPTPNRVPEYRAFLKAAGLIQTLNTHQGVEVSLGRDGSSPGMVVVFNERGMGLPERKQLLKLLGLPEHAEQIFFTSGASPVGKHYLTVETRSLIGIMYYLSHGVDASEEDEKRGRVTVTRDAKGRRFDWDAVTGEIMNIRSSPEKPGNAMVAIEYRGRWFYIDDADLSSKSTFSLLGQLFSLQAGNARLVAPALTLPVGGN